MLSYAVSHLVAFVAAHVPLFVRRWWVFRQCYAHQWGHR